MAEQRVTLELDAKAQTSGLFAFVAGLAGVKRGIEGVGAAAPALFNALSRLTSVLGPLALAGAVVKFTRDAINSADAMEEQAQKAAMSTAEFAKWTFVAGLAGASGENLITAVKGLNLWMERTGQTGRDVTEVFLEQADAIAQAPAWDRVRLAVERFGRSGQALIPVLSQGRAALAAMLAEAQDYADATARAAPAASQFNDNLSRLGLMAKTVFMEFAANVLPTLNEFLEALLKFVRENGLIEGAVGSLTDAFKILAISMASGVTQMELFMALAARGLQSHLHPIQALKGAYDDVAAAMERYRKREEAILGIGKKGPASPGDKIPPNPIQAFSTAERNSQLYAKQLQFVAEELKVRGNLVEVETEGFAAGVRRVGTLQQEYALIQSILSSKAKALADEALLVSKAQRSGVLSDTEAEEKQLAIAQAKLQVTKEQLSLKEKTNDFTFFEKLGRNFEDMADRLANFGSNLADIFSGGLMSAIDAVSTGIWGIIDGTRTWGELAQQVGRQIISQLISLAIQETIVLGVKKAAATVWKAFTSSMRAADVVEHNATEAAKAPALAANATLASIGSWGIAVVIGLAAIAGVLASIGAFETGGVVSGGRQIIQVNENGQESVLNARATAALGRSTIDAFNAGMFDLESRASGSFTTASGGSQDFSSGLGGGSEGGEIKLTLVLVDSRNAQAAMDAIVSSAGRAAIVEIVRNERTDIGIKT